MQQNTSSNISWLPIYFFGIKITLDNSTLLQLIGMRTRFKNNFTLGYEITVFH